MKKRKRAPGGGRKPEGELRDLKAVMSLRMPQDLRDQLEQARQASGRSLSQELLARARLSFDRERERSRDRALRAFCFLFSELAQVICIAPARVPDWRFDPWLFQTFKLAIPKLLDHFQPTGEMKLPGFWQAFRDCPDIVGFPSNKDERRRRTETPEAMADHAVQKVLSDFSDPKQVEHRYKSSRGWALEKMPDGSIKQAMGDFAKEWETTHYGMTRAQEDLAPRKKSRGRK